MFRRIALAAALLAAVIICSPAAAQFQVNVLQDCWTTVFEQEPELENYSFNAFEPIVFVWKHKIERPCSNYVASIFGWDCRVGKPRPGPARFRFENLQYGAIDPDPIFPERIFTFTAPPGAIPGGRYDWVILTECNDSGNGIFLGKDDDIDDECGLNTGLKPQNPLGVVIFGPEPNEFFDAAPGGFPPGRGPGEEGTTRAWCFDVGEPG